MSEAISRNIKKKCTLLTLIIVMLITTTPYTYAIEGEGTHSVSSSDGTVSNSENSSSNESKNSSNSSENKTDNSNIDNSNSKDNENNTENMRRPSGSAATTAKSQAAETTPVKDNSHKIDTKEDIYSTNKSNKIVNIEQTFRNSNDDSNSINADYSEGKQNKKEETTNNTSTTEKAKVKEKKTPEIYKVWFEVNGGAWLDYIEVMEGDTIYRVPTPERAGYAFGGWYRDMGFTKPFDPDMKIKKNLTLYAKWDNIYNIEFETNGGSEVDNVKVQEGKKLEWLPEPPIKENYQFGGWYKDEKLTEEFNADEAVNNSFELYAKWYAIIPDTAPEDASGFIDVNIDEWYFDDVNWAYNKDLMKGCNNAEFEPDSFITADMVVAVLARLADADLEEHEEAYYEDVPDGEWFTRYAKWAKGNGIIRSTSFNMPSEITREDMAIMLERFLDYIDAEYEVYNSILEFKDAAPISKEGNEALQVLFKLGIIKGKDENRIDPQSYTTRAEFATLIRRVSEFVN